MLVLSRDEIKGDEYFSKLKDYIMSNHKPADHTVENLKPMAGLENYAEETRHFILLKDKKDGNTYISYDTCTWIKEEKNGFSFPVRMERLIIYDTQIEYETARLKLRQN